MEKMMSGEPNKSQHFNGVASYGDRKFTIKNGIANVDGDTFYVSDDGGLVTNANREVVAIIQNGKVIELTQEIADQLTEAGVVEQPKRSSPQAQE